MKNRACLREYQEEDFPQPEKVDSYVLCWLVEQSVDRFEEHDEYLERILEKQIQESSQ
mgnify:CR=1 FL=1